MTSYNKILALLVIGIMTVDSLPQFGGFTGNKDNSSPGMRIFGPIAEVPGVLASHSVGAGVRAMNTGFDTVGDVVQFGVDGTFRVADGVGDSVVGTAETTRGIINDKGNYINNRISHAGDSTTKIINHGMNFFSETLGASTDFVGRVANAGMNTIVGIGNAAGDFVMGTFVDTTNLFGSTADRIAGQSIDSVQRFSQ